MGFVYLSRNSVYVCSKKRDKIGGVGLPPAVVGPADPDVERMSPDQRWYDLSLPGDLVEADTARAMMTLKLLGTVLTDTVPAQCSISSCMGMELRLLSSLQLRKTKQQLFFGAVPEIRSAWLSACGRR